MVKKGDLVVVVRTCCSPAAAKFGGWIGTVTIPVYLTSKDTNKCSFCGFPDTSLLASVEFASVEYIMSHRDLKKLDPPATGEVAGVKLYKPQGFPKLEEMCGGSLDRLTIRKTEKING